MRRVVAAFAKTYAVVCRPEFEMIGTLGRPLLRPAPGQTDNGEGIEQ